MNSPLLSIAIPTYNRCNYLLEVLPQILKQCDEIDSQADKIEVLVSDNASTDNTQERIKELHHPRIKYYRNTANIGGDANFIECVKRANGKYVWLFGDDEIIVDKSLRKIFKAIEEYHPSLLITGSLLRKSQYFRTYHEALSRLIWLRQPRFHVEHTMITFNIFLKQLFDVDRANNKISTNYGHMYGFMGNLAKAKGVYVFGKNEIFCVRKIRAEFELSQINLEEKLLEYSFYIGDINNIPMIKFNSWIFYKLINKPPLVYLRFETYKRLRQLKKFLINLTGRGQGSL